MEVRKVDLDDHDRLRVTIKARRGEILVHDARIDLHNQKDRIDFHAVASQRDDQTDWQSYLLALIAPLEAALEQQPRTEAGANPWARAIPAPSFLTQEDGEALWLVDNLVAPGAITGLMAPRGLGKTHVAHALAIAIACGGTFLGTPLQPGKVMLIDRDNASRELRRRDPLDLHPGYRTGTCD